MTDAELTRAVDALQVLEMARGRAAAERDECRELRDEVAQLRQREEHLQAELRDLWGRRCRAMTRLLRLEARR